MVDKILLKFLLKLPFPGLKVTLVLFFEFILAAFEFDFLNSLVQIAFTLQSTVICVAYLYIATEVYIVIILLLLILSLSYGHWLLLKIYNGKGRKVIQFLKYN